MKRLKQGAAALTGVLLLLSGCSGGVDEYQCVHPETGTLVQQLVEGTGTVSYREEYSVIPTVSAKILSCSIEEGDTVTAGQVLYVLDSGGVTDYSVEISLTRTEELKAGMNVTVEILVAQSEDCMSVPSEAVTGGVVRVLRDGAREPVEVPVETGLSGDGVTEIRSGLSPEDWVVVDAY